MPFPALALKAILNRFGHQKPQMLGNLDPLGRALELVYELATAPSLQQSLTIVLVLVLYFTHSKDPIHDRYRVGSRSNPFPLMTKTAQPLICNTPYIRELICEFPTIRGPNIDPYDSRARIMNTPRKGPRDL